MRRLLTFIVCCLCLQLLAGCTPALRLTQPLDPAPWAEAERYIPGNAITVLSNGPDTYASMYQAIARAQHHIHIQTYILCEDPIGREFTGKLLDRRRQGVAVRILYDHHGTAPCTSQSFLDGLRRQGLELVELRPPSDDALIYPFAYSHRDHRKLLIVDGRIAYTGGINYDDVYASKPGMARRPERGWRDTNVRIEGPAVAAFQEIFLRRWRGQRPLPELPGSGFFPPPERSGDAGVQVLTSVGGGGLEINPIYRDYLRAITHARKRVWLTHSYVMPEPNLMRALLAAAARGVDVRLMLPGFSDVPMLYPIARTTYARLLEGGVRLFERRDAFVHAKTGTVDGVWSTIGSLNLDYRSLVHNDEINAMILDRQVARRMERLFLSDASYAVELHLESVQKRSLRQRALEWLGLTLAYWL